MYARTCIYASCFNDENLGIIIIQQCGEAYFELNCVDGQSSCRSQASCRLASLLLQMSTDMRKSSSVAHPFTPAQPSLLRKYVTPTTVGALISATLLASPLGDDVIGGELAGHQFLQAIFGFVVGYSGLKSFLWLRLKLLRSLLTYRGWVTAPKSLKTKVRL